ncbi:MAG: DmsC/YnfH family molybdoenzyme membrane anchor subunit [Bacteroidota bacterium]|nr:DmsC/YnfH family molybdoenzyme membrane anchor subunit [Bacteroidota bacterium]MDP4192785.1 DmsC/YnfH family molybdoenzyme membrane anchor subunit [Bacteroidota bacterium]
MRSSEWPLIFFTLMIQMSAGFFVILSILHVPIFAENEIIVLREILCKLPLVICLIIALALAISFFHLGNPKNALYVLTNISSSWLSREILLTIVFSIFAFTASFIIYMNFFPFVFEQLILALTAISGIALVYSMSRLYMLKTVPTWNSNYTMISFYLSAATLGLFSLLTILIYFLKQSGISIGQLKAQEGLANFILAVCFILIASELVLGILQFKSLRKEASSTRNKFNLIVQRHRYLIMFRFILGIIILFLIFIIIAMQSKTIVEVSHLIYISFTLMIVSEFCGRYLFYEMYASIGI